jgi:cytochrome c-type biogenesis protein CcmH
MMRALLLSIVLLVTLSAQAPIGSSGPDALADPKLEARAVALQKELRCLVCQGQSLDESPAPLAEDLRRFIRMRIAAGESDDRVKQDLVARYGDVILMAPPLMPETYLLWFGPLLVLVVCASVTGVVVIRARARSRRKS